MKTLKDTPPWDWPEGTGKMFLDLLRDDQAPESDRLLAAELAGDFTVINDELVDALAVHPAQRRLNRRSYAARRRSPWGRSSSMRTRRVSRMPRPPDRGTHVPHDPAVASHALHGRRRSEGRAAADPGGIGARPAGLAPGCDPCRIRERRRGLEAHRRLLHALRSRIR